MFLISLPQDYRELITSPMDLTTAKEKLTNDGYEDPTAFGNDVRLVFQNSKNYNTNKKSRVSLSSFNKISGVLFVP